MMAGLWEIEADIRGQDPETRVKARQERSAAIVAALFDSVVSLSRNCGLFQRNRTLASFLSGSAGRLNGNDLSHARVHSRTRSPLRPKSSLIG